MPARRRNPDSRTVRIVAYVSPETEARITKHAAQLNSSIGAALDEKYTGRAALPGMEPKPRAAAKPHEFVPTGTGLVRLCKHCGAGEKSAEGRVPACPGRRDPA